MTTAEQYPSEGGFLPLMEYGDLELPEFTEEQEAIRTMYLRFDDFFDSVKEHEWSVEGRMNHLVSLESSYAFRYIDERLAEFVEKKVKELGVSDELATHAAIAVKKKKWQGVPEGSSEKFVLRELITRANRLKAQLVHYWLETAEETGLNPVAEAEYTHVVYAMAAADRMAIKLLAEKFPIDSEERERRGLTNDCAVVQEFGGKVIEVPLHEVYPEEIDAAVACYEDLLEELDHLEEVYEEAPDLLDLIERKQEYYAVLIRAYKTSDPKDWKLVDSLLTGQIRDGNDVFHVHSIETGYLGDGMIRFPEVGLRALDLDEGEANMRSQEVKRIMIDSLQNQKYFGDSPAVATTLDLIRQSNATFRHFMGSGLENDLKPTGQVLPNDEKSRMIGGIDASFDMESVVLNLPDKKKTFADVFGDEALQEYCEGRSIEMAMVGFVASHEFGHSVAVLPDTDKRLGGKDFIMGPFVEEWKASAAGIVANEYIPYQEGELDIDKLKTAIIDHLLIAGRYASQRNAGHYKNYFRKSMIFLKLMEEAGVLEHTGEPGEHPWKINLEDDRVVQFYDRLFEKFKDLVKIYGEGDEQDLRNFQGELLQTCNFTGFLCEKLDVPDGEKNTPVDFTRLPAPRSEKPEENPDVVVVLTQEAVSEVEIPESSDKA